ncbi:P-loop containing nucleoside triphosphate hydrolase protein [Cladochytrium replicatum]|nr:P-loop containing nucleoside triphosphate hydrolase protein [Cladochytrium replicatum]
MENGDEEEHIAGSTSITRLLVAVRLRPLSQRELDRDNCTVVARAADSHQVQLIDPIDDDDVLRKDRPREWLYEYDYVFPESTDQVELYQKTTKSLIDWVIEGYNATVFAYGATGAGKTYTMLGTEDSPGVIVLALVDLFEHIEHHQALPHRPRFDVTMSYLEIYNENIRDLLSGSSEPLDLREDAHRGVVVSGISSVIARSAEEVLGYLEQGNKNRIQEATGANEVSSRSHAVLQVQVSCKHINAKNATVQRYGKLSMIDLAGSERAAETQNRGIRMIEGANINRSLLALANCINALVDSKKGKYVNFRDSKLTRLLKDSLGGNCRTVMISNISPANHNFDETHNTLKYANRARSIKTKVSQHVFHRTDPCSVALNAIRADLTNIRENLRSPPQLPSRLRKRTHTDPPPSAESSARPHWDSTPSTAHAKHKPDTYITDMRSEVQQIFAEQVHIRNEIIGADAEIWECLDAIGKAKRDVEGLTRRLDKSDEDQREGGATGLERAKMKVGRHEKRKIGASRKRGELVGRLDELDERLQELFQVSVYKEKQCNGLQHPLASD